MESQLALPSLPLSDNPSLCQHSLSTIAYLMIRSTTISFTDTMVPVL